MVTELQKKTAQGIINIFETGKLQGDYSNVTVARNDPGHLTYGRSQTTLASGNLYLLIKAYCSNSEAEFASKLQPYLIRLKNQDLSLDFDRNLHQILREAGQDPVMEEEQDLFFDRVYWNPAIGLASNISINTVLGITVVYDSKVHGSWKTMRDRTISRFGTVANLGEKSWVTHYVSVRRNWLANHSNSLLRRTVYRMDALQKLINQGNWDLSLPFSVRGIQVDEDSLQGTVRISAQDVEERLLQLKSPNMQGDDVKELQEALVKAGFELEIDSIFGVKTKEVVREFQEQKGLRVDGIVGSATRAALAI